MSSPPNERNERNGASDGLLFITGTSLEDFKSTTNMTNVRKKAMGSYLKEKKPRGAQKEHRGPKEDPSGSRSSFGSDQQDIISNSEAIRLMNGDSRRKSSQNTLFQSSPKTRTRKTPESQVSRLPTISMDFVLPSAPIVIPSRTGVPLPYDETSPKPFQSIGKPLDPFRTMFQASHPQVSVEELKFHCSRSFGTKAMGMHWIPTLVKSPHAFLSTLCIASAHYDAINERQFESIQTLALRQEVIHLINRNLSNPASRWDDYNVIALTQLLASEIIAGEDLSLDFHETGIQAMVYQRGGLEQLGVNGRLASTLSWVSLECAILREAKPRPQYVDYAAAASTRIYPNTATIPESPLYCPRSEFETIKRSSRCSSQALDMLKDIRMRMDLFLHDTKQSRHNSLSLKNIHKKITTQYPPISELLRKKNVLTASDWRYEAIRITAIVTATAIAQRTPLSEALKHVANAENSDSLDTFLSIATTHEDLTSPTALRQDSPLTAPANPFALPTARSFSSLSLQSDPTTSLLKHLKTTLEHSNLSDCWADMAGVLLWVALTAGAASRKNESKVLKRWFKALAMRVSIVLCFEHPEAIHASMLRMGDLVVSVGGKGEGDVRGKRRKE
ncbi:hypothetical protein SLS60_002607 [Paraconiothyrium brasiliense]|uniref:Tachykinin family protein n=1 Tax=Paraconiothyrium brasiliense TaxID=300254 RepID=A0ABR3RTJ3_9PLEO